MNSWTGDRGLSRAWSYLIVAALSILAHLWVLQLSWRGEPTPQVTGSRSMTMRLVALPTRPPAVIAANQVAVSDAEPAQIDLVPPPEPVPEAVVQSGEPDADLGWAAYVPRPELSAPPQAQQPVLLAWPDFRGDQSLYTLLLVLYIDEQGLVRRIDIEDSDAPPVFQDAARQAFSGVSFLPGQRDGVPVKSRVHIEVSFEQPMPEPGPSRGLKP
ncbi:energy transducer TonB [Paucibacter sp. XJ19-41]|uniref:energy transducer TonB n=1 Tax=Paucibacter sp. XJ19-41 TaxID=2927824 RepID=UPI00234B41B9|nr:energy transducer TonB [Paucibacter sp. XJ19-41]MDC6166072.1 energy transducer TonB [Paucibacter sp. XJ19-41]